MTIFDEVNSLPEELIARRLGLSTARDGKSFICPACGNGSGKTGDGIKQTKLKGKLVWHCYRCDGHWSNVDLVAQVEGISTSDSAELAKIWRRSRRKTKSISFFLGKVFRTLAKPIGKRQKVRLGFLAIVAKAGAERQAIAVSKRP